MNEIGEDLRSTRESAGISVLEASKDLNIKKEFIENIENGKIGAFKDIFELKDYIASYAKYLGLDDKKILNEFNEYLFEYTSRIPVKEIEKAVKEKNEEEKETDRIRSPYTKKAKKNDNLYIMIYVIVLLLVIVTIIWSVKQITIDKNIATAISYVE